jgi:glucosamine-6-phosphate deaminase
MQQVHDRQFATLDDVPKTALTLTIPAITRVRELILNVPGKAKARAVQAAVEGPVTPDCPASVLQRHANTTVFLDRDSAELLTSAK